MNQIKLTELTQKLDLLEVANHYNLDLKKSGANWKCKSPWNDENTASCMFSPEKQIFKDFSSGKGGDCIEFIKEMEGLGYVEALMLLGSIYGIDLEDDVDPKVLTKRAQIYESTRILSAYFISCLKESGEAQKYASRFSQESIDKWALGYCPMKPPEQYAQHFITSGLISEKGFNLIQGRLIFPIRSRSGSVLSFTGRRMDDGKEYKYLNGQETEVFSKSSTLYGLFESKSEIIKTGHGILVEGNPDTITSHEYGHKNVVCPLGTSFTENQIKECLRMTRNWTIINDGDSAGAKATIRDVKMFLNKGVEPKVLNMPSGIDPDLYLKENLSYDFSQSVGGIEYMATGKDLDGEFFNTLVKYLDGIENPHLKNVKAIQLSNSFGLSREFIEVRKKWNHIHESEEFCSNQRSKSLIDLWQKTQMNQQY
ncbi:MAG: DNA primase [Cyclobacteriaceae bacterium]|jgi:DNA primase